MFDFSLHNISPNTLSSSFNSVDHVMHWDRGTRDLGVVTPPVIKHITVPAGNKGAQLIMSAHIQAKGLRELDYGHAHMHRHPHCSEERTRKKTGRNVNGCEHTHSHTSSLAHALSLPHTHTQGEGIIGKLQRGRERALPSED